MTEVDEARLATHEAGHAVIARLLGVAVQSTTIQGDDGAEGRLKLVPGYTVSAADMVKVWVAGGASVAELHGEQFAKEGTPSDDAKAMSQALRISDGDRDAAEKYVANARTHVRELISSSQRRGLEILDVAMALMNEGTLDGARLDTVIAAAEK